MEDARAMLASLGKQARIELIGIEHEVSRSIVHFVLKLRSVFSAVSFNPTVTRAGGLSRKKYLLDATASRVTGLTADCISRSYRLALAYKARWFVLFTFGSLLPSNARSLRRE